MKPMCVTASCKNQVLFYCVGITIVGAAGSEDRLSSALNGGAGPQQTTSKVPLVLFTGSAYIKPKERNINTLSLVYHFINLPQ